VGDWAEYRREWGGGGGWDGRAALVRRWGFGRIAFGHMPSTIPSLVALAILGSGVGAVDAPPSVGATASAVVDAQSIANAIPWTDADRTRGLRVDPALGDYEIITHASGMGHMRDYNLLFRDALVYHWVNQGIYGGGSGSGIVVGTEAGPRLFLVGDRNVITAVDLTNGQELWHDDLIGPPAGNRELSVESIGVGVTFRDGLLMLFVGDNGSACVELKDPATGITIAQHVYERGFHREPDEVTTVLAFGRRDDRRLFTMYLLLRNPTPTPVTLHCVGDDAAVFHSLGLTMKDQDGKAYAIKAAASPSTGSPRMEILAPGGERLFRIPVGELIDFPDDDLVHTISLHARADAMVYSQDLAIPLDVSGTVIIDRQHPVRGQGEP
jgi:hypothetical protein